MPLDLSIYPTDDLIHEITRRCSAAVILLAQLDEDGKDPEYALSLRGAPHAIVGLGNMLHIAISEKAAALMAEDSD